mmetsp:Transcript_102628/g.260678  ORF Transcript_102628/g.260678 Transcript_102628/m.260678 type:complete len:86 (-) Transcript_102628:77-334(-)
MQTPRLRARNLQHSTMRNTPKSLPRHEQTRMQRKLNQLAEQFPFATEASDAPKKASDTKDPAAKLDMTLRPRQVGTTRLHLFGDS